MSATGLHASLHDSVTQSLYSVTLYAEAAARQVEAGNQEAVIDHLRELRDTSRDALREMRLLIYELRPPEIDRIGLAAALRSRLQAVETRGGVHAELVQEGDENLPVAAQQELYHIAREALNNSLKHAQATPHHRAPDVRCRSDSAGSAGRRGRIRLGRGHGSGRHGSAHHARAGAAPGRAAGDPHSRGRRHSGACRPSVRRTRITATHAIAQGPGFPQGSSHCPYKSLRSQPHAWFAIALKSAVVAIPQRKRAL